MSEMSDLEMITAMEVFKASFIKEMDERMAARVDPMAVNLSEAQELLKSVNARLRELEQGRTITGRIRRYLGV
jgi:hypothetical protein